MVKDDLWSDSADEFIDAGVSIDLVAQETGISTKGGTPTAYAKSLLKKTALIKVAESNISFSTYLFEQPRQNHLSAPSTVPKTPIPAPIIFDDLWSDSSDELIVTEPLPAVENGTGFESQSLDPSIDFDESIATEETDPDLELEDDLWTFSEDLQTLDEDEELTEVWNNSRQGFAREGNSTGASFVELPQSDFEGSFDLLMVFEDTPALRGFKRAVESRSFLDGFEFIDIEAELADLERVEAELAVGKSSVEPGDGTVSRSRRGQAPGWMGSGSLLYINWDDEEKAEKEALERLGYSKINLSDATRTFIIQAARAYKLTLRQERLITNQLAKARSLLAQLPNSDDCESLQLRAEIVDLEQTLVYNLQWVAVKKARHFLGRGLELDDLIQYGLLGVIAGIRHFDASKNARLLVAVNWWVFQALSRAVTEYKPLIQLPIYIHERLASIKKHRTKLEMVLERLPTYEELATAVQMPVERLKELLSLPTTISLDHYKRAEYTNDGYSFQVVEGYMGVSEEDSMSVVIDEIVKKQIINAMLYCLTPRERYVIELRFGLDDRDECTLDEVGKVLRVTRERVRQIEEKALKKITRSIWRSRWKWR